MLPRPIRDWLYDRVATARHRIARRDSCPLTEESMDRGMRERFLD
jgi:predicted DCC family thiol-disulfide oxidoreductase YuxK